MNYWCIFYSVLSALLLTTIELTHSNMIWVGYCLLGFIFYAWRMTLSRDVDGTGCRSGFAEVVLDYVDLKLSSKTGLFLASICSLLFVLVWPIELFLVWLREIERKRDANKPTLNALKENLEPKTNNLKE